MKKRNHSKFDNHIAVTVHHKFSPMSYLCNPATPVSITNMYKCFVSTFGYLYIRSVLLATVKFQHKVLTPFNCFTMSSFNFIAWTQRCFKINKPNSHTLIHHEMPQKLQADRTHVNR